MPRAFTPDESARIRERLMTAAQESFARRGLRGTSVDDLARAAAISKGAFYRFFDSKEALLLALLDQLEVAMQADVEAAVRAEPQRGLELLLSAAVHAIERNPLMSVAMSEEGLRAIHALPAEQQQRLFERDIRLMERVVAMMRAAGVPVALPHDALLGLLRSLVLVGSHREEIGPELVEAATDWLAGALRHAAPAPGPVNT